jgi:hypothetical protein
MICHCGADYVRMSWAVAAECPYPELLTAILQAWSKSPDASYVAVCGSCGCVQPYGYRNDVGGL